MPAPGQSKRWSPDFPMDISISKDEVRRKIQEDWDIEDYEESL